MTSREMSILALRVLGLWAAVQGVGGLPIAITGTLHSFELDSELVDGYPAYLMIGIYLQPVTYCVVAALLIVFAPQLSSFFYRDQAPHDPALTTSLNVTDLYRIGAQLLGIYAFLQAVPPIARNTVWFVSSEPGRLMHSNGVDTVQAILYLACSVYLVFGARRIASDIMKLRNYALNDDDQQTASEDSPDTHR